MFPDTLSFSSAGRSIDLISRISVDSSSNLAATSSTSDEVNTPRHSRFVVMRVRRLLPEKSGIQCETLIDGVPRGNENHGIYPKRASNQLGPKLR